MTKEEVKKEIEQLKGELKDLINEFQQQQQQAQAIAQKLNQQLTQIQDKIKEKQAVINYLAKKEDIDVEIEAPKNIVKETPKEDVKKVKEDNK
jgi:uncharacterized coiled-coil protein SlyX